MPAKDFTGRTLAYKPNCLRSVTLIEVKPSPTGVVNGPFKVILFFSITSSVSLGRSSPVFSSAVKPASTIHNQNHSLQRLRSQ